jgi:putative redox protein
MSDTTTPENEKPWLTATCEDPVFRTKMAYRDQVFYADEPENLGGGNSAPSPGVLLLASLASCTIITIRMYAQRKGYDVTGLQVKVRYFSEQAGSSKKTRFEKQLLLPAHLDESVKERLRQVSEACPVSKMLNGEMITETVLA